MGKNREKEASLSSGMCGVPGVGSYKQRNYQKARVGLSVEHKAEGRGGCCSDMRKRREAGLELIRSL